MKRLIQHIRGLFTPTKWYYYEIEDEKVIYTDWAVSWLRWAKKQNPIIDSMEGFTGEIQFSIFTELLICDIRFARTKTPDKAHNFYRVRVLGGPLDGKAREVATKQAAEALLQEWSNATWEALEAEEDCSR